MENDALSATVEAHAFGVQGSIATAPTVYLSARGQDIALVAAVVKARLESQGCVVCYCGTEVRTRAQCAHHYGPLLHDCDVFIQLIGVDPGPVLSNEDGDDDFWSLQVWEAREAARRRKPTRHYLLDDDFCRTMFPDTEQPAHVLKKQAQHRRKLASSPSKVRQVRDTDELLSLLPDIRIKPVLETDVYGAAPSVPAPPATELRSEPSSTALASSAVITTVTPSSLAREPEALSTAVTAALPAESQVTFPPLSTLPPLPEIPGTPVTPHVEHGLAGDLPPVEDFAPVSPPVIPPIPALPSTSGPDRTSDKESNEAPLPLGKEPSVPARESDSNEPTIVLMENIEIEVRSQQVEAVTQAPMKLEMGRADRYRMSTRPCALERRGLPRRGLPSWMLKRSEDHSSPVRPVPGRRAYVKAPKAEEGETREHKEPSFLKTLILPDTPPLRKYLRRTFFVFRLTDSVAVRRLSEATKRKPGMAIATGVGVVVLAGLLVKVSADYFLPGSIATLESLASDNPALATPSQPGVSVAAPNRKPDTTQAATLAGSKSATAASTSATKSQPVVASTVAPSPSPAQVSAKAGSVAKAAAPSTVPGPQQPAEVVSPTSANVDEQQKFLEKALEEAILARRKSGVDIQAYARDHESEIIELQHRIQELIPVRSGHGSSGSPQALSLSRCLASTHLLGGRNQAARNVLLDLRDAIAQSRSEGNPELRLTDYLLELTATDALKDSRTSTTITLPLTPDEMEALLAKFASDPAWKPAPGGAIVGSDEQSADQ